MIYNTNIQKTYTKTKKKSSNSTVTAFLSSMICKYDYENICSRLYSSAIFIASRSFLLHMRLVAFSCSRRKPFSSTVM